LSYAYAMLIDVRIYVEDNSTKIRFPFNERRNADIKNYLRVMEAVWGNSWGPNWRDGPFCWEVFHLQDDHKGRKLFYLPEFLSSPREKRHLENMIGSQITCPRPIGRRLYNSDTQEISYEFNLLAPLPDDRIASPSTPPRRFGEGERPGTPPTTPRIAKRLKFDEDPFPATASATNMSAKQQSFLASALGGKNVFLTGAAGTGKTFAINEVVRRLRARGKQVAVTSSTGNTAVAIEGQTLYSLIGCGLCESTHDLRRIWGRKKDWRSIDVLIVDEISMIQVRFCYKIQSLMPP
jgi:hypothetical protein